MGANGAKAGSMARSPIGRMPLGSYLAGWRAAALSCAFVTKPAHVATGSSVS